MRRCTKRSRQQNITHTEYISLFEDGYDSDGDLDPFYDTVELEGNNDYGENEDVVPSEDEIRRRVFISEDVHEPPPSYGIQ